MGCGENCGGNCGKKCGKCKNYGYRCFDLGKQQKIFWTGFGAFLAIAGLWKLTDDEQVILLGVDKKLFCRVKKHLSEGKKVALVSEEILIRISYILGIYKALHILFPRDEMADTWIKLPNTEPLFEKRPALEVMLSGKIDDLKLVCDYLRSLCA